MRLLGVDCGATEDKVRASVLLMVLLVAETYRINYQNYLTLERSRILKCYSDKNVDNLYLEKSSHNILYNVKKFYQY